MRWRSTSAVVGVRPTCGAFCTAGEFRPGGGRSRRPGKSKDSAALSCTGHTARPLLRLRPDRRASGLPKTWSSNDPLDRRCPRRFVHGRLRRQGRGGRQAGRACQGRGQGREEGRKAGEEGREEGREEG